MSQEDYYVFVYLAVLLYNIPIFIDFDLLNVWNEGLLLTTDNEKIDKRTMAQMHHLIEEQVKKTTVKDLDKEFFMRYQLPYLQKFLYIESKKYQSAKLNIFISSISSYVLAQFVKKRILSVYNEEMIIFVEDIEDADVVLTNQRGIIRKDVDYFIIKNFLDEQEWGIILRKISDRLLKKMNS